MCVELAPPASTDRRAIAADLCGLLACGAADPTVSLEQLARAAREIAAFLQDDHASAARPMESRTLRVIEGGRQ
ncbi:MAG: hypothetical protein SFW09_21395 [Hyphomicrobiaceae bacterium]|nr:hypothetical protein [Hyphomicrobiaceae bacterium]